MSTRERGWVYLIVTKDRQYVKIGYTARSVSKRLDTLLSGHVHGDAIQLWRSVLTERHVERWLHHRFDHLRVRGEWFHNRSEISDWFIKADVDPEFLANELASAHTRGARLRGYLWKL